MKFVWKPKHSKGSHWVLEVDGIYSGFVCRWGDDVESGLPGCQDELTHTSFTSAAKRLLDIYK